MTSNLFIPIKFKTTISLEPKEINSKFNDVILNKLKKNLENVCSKHGFIKKDSLKIIKRSCGMFKSQHFNGNIIFNIQCIAEICNPAQGSIIKCKVKAKNSLGVLAEGYYDNIPILEIIIPKISAGIQSEINIDTININDDISIEVCGKKYQLFDKHISIIGRAIKNKEENIKTAIINLDEDLLLNNSVEEADIEEIYTESDKDDEEVEVSSVKEKKKGGIMDDEDDEDEDDEHDEDDVDELDEEEFDDLDEEDFIGGDFDED
jgi:hypothetical protein